MSQNLMQDMRCKKGHFLKHFVMPDEDLKKKGYAVDVIDESTFIFMKACIPSIFLWINRDFRYLKLSFPLRISDWNRRESLDQF